MEFKTTACALLAGALLIAMPNTEAAAEEYLMVTGSSSNFRGIALFDTEDGSLVDASYLNYQDSSGVLKHPMQVGDEIWIAAQLAAVIHRFTLDGEYLGDIDEAQPGQPLNNIRGMELVGDTVYLANSGDTGGAPGPAIVQYDLDGNWVSTASAAGSSPFSVLYYNDELLVGHNDTPDIHRHDLDGEYLGVFYDGPISWVQQMNTNEAGNVLATGWSSNGLYELDADGDIVNQYGAGSPRGVHELGDGNLLWTNSNGVHVLDVDSQTSTTVLSDFSGQYIDRLVLDEPTIPGDLTGDGQVGGADLGILLSEWGACDDCDDCPADLTGDCEVGGADLGVLLSNWTN